MSTVENGLAKEFHKHMELKIDEADKTKATLSLPTSFYEDNLPKDIPIEVLKKAQDFNSQMFVAAVDATSKHALSAFEKNKNLQVINANVNLVGKDSFDIAASREKERRNPKTGETFKVYNDITAKLSIHGADSTRGELKKTMSALRDEALAKLGGK